MKVSVKVQPKAKEQKIEKVGDFDYKVYFNVPPENGRANAKLVEILAEYFGVSKSQVFITFGSRSKNKVVEIVDYANKEV